ncbi:MAG: hypothetical protein KDK39_19540, partial [Leptospiraceae bacterium]|nr:hypothetical protein [Leptospiraceae bacterium]
SIRNAGRGPAPFPFPGRRVASVPEPDSSDTQQLQWDIWLWNLRSAWNAGAIVRTIECLGLGSVWLIGHSPGPDHKAFTAAAMGCENRVRINHLDTINEAKSRLTQMRSRTPIVALETGTQSIPIQQFTWPRHGILLLGNEELGLPDAALQLASARVAIPMFGRKASLNVASAFAIAASQIRFQTLPG